MKTAKILDFIQELNVHEYNLKISCGDGSIDDKSTELNTEKGLKNKDFPRVGGILPAFGNTCLYPLFSMKIKGVS